MNFIPSSYLFSLRVPVITDSFVSRNLKVLASVVEDVRIEPEAEIHNYQAILCNRSFHSTMDSPEI